MVLKMLISIKQKQICSTKLRDRMHNKTQKERNSACVNSRATIRAHQTKQMNKREKVSIIQGS